MNKEKLFKAFQELFPDWAKKATSYKKIGSKTLAIRFATEVTLGEDSGEVKEESRVFLYIDQNNWQFGTKLWRKRPEHVKKPKNTAVVREHLES